MARFWKVPFPYDYHEQGEILVFDVETAEEARERARQSLAPWYMEEKGHLLGEPVLVETSVPYFNEGCDC